MHLLAVTPGTVSDGAEAVDLGQTPGELVVLTAADSEIACLAVAARRRPQAPTLRLANLLRLGHPMSVDLHVDKVVRHAKLVVVRLLGGRSYWPYGVEQVAQACRAGGIPVAFLPGDATPDSDLEADSTLPPEAARRLWGYLTQGGIDNAEQFLRYAAALLGDTAEWREPAPLPPAGVLERPWRDGAPVAAVVFYRALVQSGNLEPIEGLCDALAAQGLNPLPVHVASLKDPLAAAILGEALDRHPPDIVLNCTGFAVASAEPQFGDRPVLQVVLASGDEGAWRDGTRGLGPRDVAMNVALPEVDGRIITRAVSFKAALARDSLTQADVVTQRPVPDRCAFVAELAAAWVRLRRAPPEARRVALVLANYPNRDGRLGNGVGLDTPASTIGALGALAGAGYDVAGAPTDGAALMALIQAGPTNDLVARPGRSGGEDLALPDYHLFFSALPDAVQKAVRERWGPPEADPHFRPGALDCGRFVISAIRFGKVAVAVQPARGYNIDPVGSFHDPALVPPHGYLAFYAWLRREFHAVVHMGKHGNLEWLPGKGLALSAECFPEVALGPMPHLYPFIVNDPGEGTQAKRRAQAVIIDHLTPPLTRAETYGPLREIEQLVDEYWEAAQLDPRRLPVLTREIATLARASGLDIDCGVTPEDGERALLAKLDSKLCELKELQIRDGLHVFGRSPEGRQLVDLLVALARTPRGGRPEDASLIRALADDLKLGFDPLDDDLSQPWTGPRPAALVGEDRWRTEGDTVERLERLAQALLAGEAQCGDWPRARAVLDWIETTLRPAVTACGAAELAGLLRGLDGRFVAPGPSGAPSRGRPDVLPTGRNFFSVDTRTVPTPAAWHLGWASAGLLLERHAREHGEWPRAVAVTAWGTSNMRTGGDDIAQAMALMGVRPVWEPASRRVTGFEIMPAGVLGRPRVDVTLRVSGFFRDAFPALIDLFDSAARAVAALDEADDVNPLAARVRDETKRLSAEGLPEAEARRRAGFRVFGSKPGAYGAGLQALIDERGWTSRADLGRAYVAWGGFAYGDGAEGLAAHRQFEGRLARIEAVVQNQDNREHDLLDSDDYYQFEGGMAAAVASASGAEPAVYHPDHSRPETPRIRTLTEEIARVVRGRVVNPKWIEGAMRHGYKGAFEMAATVDYLFAFAASTRCVRDHHFDLVLDAYLRDEPVRAFLAEANPAALREMADRLQEAIDRGLWRPRGNDTHRILAEARL